MVVGESIIIERAKLLYGMGQCDQAVNLLAQAVERYPRQLKLCARLAELLIDSEQYASALQVLSQVPFKKVADGEAMQLSAICHQALGNFAIAQEMADQLMNLEEQKATGLVIKGRIAAATGDPVLAERHFRDAASLDAGCGLAYLGLGELQRLNGHRDKALYLFEKAFQLLPISRAATIAFYESAVADNCYQRAERVFRDALLHHPVQRRLRLFLIDLLLRQGQWQAAMSEVESTMAQFGYDEGILTAALNLRNRVGVRPIDQSQVVRKTVSLCMIVKNEGTHLARCLHSVKPIVDELIIVDTGSTDRTRDIASVFGARVFDLPWEDDFAVARNFSLSKARGDWILVLDADEVISGKSHDALRRLLQQPMESGSCAFRVQTRNYTNHANTIGWKPNRGEYPDEEGMGWFPSDKVRVFPNDARIRFTNPVHELVEPCLRELKIPIRACDIPVHHYGKLGETLTQEKTKQYRTLSQKKLQKTRRDASGLRELAIQSTQLNKYEEALDLWKELLKQQPKSTETHLNMSAAYWNLGRYPDALKSARKALHLSPEVREASFNQAIALLMMGRVEEAKSILERLVDQHPDYPAAQFMFGIACVCVGEQRPIEAALAKIRSLPIGQYLGESFLDIAKRLLKASQPALARRTLESAVMHQYATAEILAMLEGCRIPGSFSEGKPNEFS
jgi:tetratricopeptide (TPR) repeat protein